MHRNFENEYASRPVAQQIIADPYNLHLKRAQRYVWLLEQAATLEADSHCLDIGTGLGQGSWILSQQTARVVGIDISEFAITFAQQTYQNPGLTFVCADFLDSVLNEIFDHIFCVHFLEHIPRANAPLVVKKIRQLCHSRSSVYLNLPLEGSLAGRYSRAADRLKKIPPHDPTHISFYTARAVNALFTRHGFRLVRLHRMFFPSKKLKTLLEGRMVPGIFQDLFTVEGFFLFQPAL